MQDVVLMVAESDLVTAEFLREVEKLLSSHPRAKKAGLFLSAEAGGSLCRLLWHSSMLNLEASSLHVEGNAQRITECLQIAGIRFVMDVLHPHVQSLYAESWVMNLCALC